MQRSQRRLYRTLSQLTKSTPLKRTFQSVHPPRASLAGETTMSGAAAEDAAAFQSQTQQPDYSTWSNASLVARITELERQLHSRTAEYVPSAPKGDHEAGSNVPPAPPAGRPSDADTAKTANANESASTDSQTKRSKPPKGLREIDPSKYHTRFIALKFAYLGQRYNGLEHANGNVTPLPTIEEELWKALRRTRLIFPTDPGTDTFDDRRAPRALKPFSLNWDGCDYSKAGRTDRGVSAFGQVVTLRVRSARPKVQKGAAEPSANGEDTTMQTEETASGAPDDGWDDIADELPYVTMLNKVLPEDIRVLAWCPHLPPNFDARFSCRERHYRYFFTQPAFTPTPGPRGFIPHANNKTQPPKYREGWLDIDAMREAARMFEGSHDFRNFCKLDTSKQIENFVRTIHHSDIELLDPRTHPLGYVKQPGFRAVEEDPGEGQGDDEPSEVPDTSLKVYVFNLQGNAFLWHQVRHMVSVLFLVGQGLEPPSIVSDLLDISKNPRKPQYEMGSDAPLVLWDCVYPDLESTSREDSLEWIYTGDTRQDKKLYGKGGSKFGLGGLIEDLWSVWRQRKMDEILAGSLLDLAISQGDQGLGNGDLLLPPNKSNQGPKIFAGAHDGKIGGRYVQVMQKRKNEPVEVLNARWLATKQRKTEQGAQPSRMEI